MIRRPHGDTQLLITQPDHAKLAAEIMRQWRRDGLAESPRRDVILLAIAEHDNGWLEVDAAPVVHPSTGHIQDFVEIPDALRRGVWPRGVDRLASSPYAAALVAHHAVYVLRRYRDEADWKPFFADLEARRDRHLAAAGVSFEELLGDYRFVRAGDLASLAFCANWTEEQNDGTGYAIRMAGERLVVTPDPFTGETVPIEVAARVLPHGAFASAAAAAHAYASAPVVTLAGVITGGP